VANGPQILFLYNRYAYVYIGGGHFRGKLSVAALVSASAAHVIYPISLTELQHRLQKNSTHRLNWKQI